MIKNNKGVTLVELLIVIVVMGIIAAFAIPAVGTIIDNTQKDAVVADALQVENAANLYCAQTTCGDTEALTWAEVSPYLKGISTDVEGGYDVTTTVTGDVVVAEILSAGAGWTVTLEGFTTSAPFVYEWPAGIPSELDREHVEMDAN